MEKIKQKFDITIQAKDSDTTLSLKGVDYDYFLKAYTDYANKLEINVRAGNHIKSIRSIGKTNYNPYNNLNSM